MIGKLGESIEVYVFDNSHKDKISPSKNGAFGISLNGTSFDYALPLSALVEKKTCPVDNKQLSGNWIYCPWHGNELINKK